MIVSVGLLSMAMKSVPAGTAYAVWSGIGIAGTAAFGAMLLGEPLSVGQVICLVLILVGVTGLKMLA